MERLAEADRIRVGFVDPVNWEVLLDSPASPRPTAEIRHSDKVSGKGTAVEVAVNKVLELAVPFGQLGLKAGDPVRFYIELLSGESSLDRAPREGIFELTVPSVDFERIMWQV